MARTANGEIVRASEGAEDIGKWVNSNLGAVQLAMPGGFDAAGFSQRLMAEIKRTPKLLQCDRFSLLNGFVCAAQLGLEIGSGLGQCWLIPYGREATLVVGYRGLLSLVYRSGLVDSIDCEVVREGDHFSYQLGTNPDVDHRKATGAEGEITHAYAIAWLKGSQRPKVAVMTWAEIETIKKASRAGARGGPWNQWTGEMAKKTVLRRICKTLPQSAEPLHRAAIIDEFADANVSQPNVIESESFESSAGELSPVDEPALEASNDAV